MRTAALFLIVLLAGTSPALELSNERLDFIGEECRVIRIMADAGEHIDLILSEDANYGYDFSDTSFVSTGSDEVAICSRNLVHQVVSLEVRGEDSSETLLLETEEPLGIEPLVGAVVAIVIIILMVSRGRR